MPALNAVLFTFFRTFVLSIAALVAAGAAHAAKVELRPATDAGNDSALWSDLRSALPDERRPETLFEARRQADRATQIVSDVLNSNGYYDPQITAHLETGTIALPVIEVDPGALFHIHGIELAFEANAPTQDEIDQALADLQLHAGDVAIPTKIIDAERQLSQFFQRAGYAFADVSNRRVRGDREAAELQITYTISLGSRVRFGEIRLPEEARTKANYLRGLSTFEAGDVYEPSTLAAYSARLNELRIYRIANVRLSPDAVRTTPEGDAIHDVIVTLTERERNTVAVGASIATDVGVGLSLDYTRRNFSGRGDTLTAGLTLAQLEQEIEVIWRRPNEYGYGRNVVLSTNLSNEETDGFDRQQIGVSAALEVSRSPEFSYTVGTTASLIHETDDFGERDLQLLGLFLAARLDRSDDYLNPTRGWRLDARVDPNVSFGSEQSQFVRTEVQGRAYWPVLGDDDLVLAGRVKIGSVYGADIDALPSDSRFYSGGGGSVRGYGYQAIGPRSASNDPIGGRAALETSVEARWQVRPQIGLVGFIDGGSVSRTEVPSLSELRFGAGLGVRYLTPAGPLRIDIATPLDRSQFDDPVQVYIALGQAF